MLTPDLWTSAPAQTFDESETDAAGVVKDF